ncbi:zonular occludens toxin domain-containing protein [Plesiomonas shigelloides]|uniref:zonular occludens toxin domain-containing protein n=1 Tax=Plesiomonas shigelloides TaxID=703 RepID=UPI00387F2B57
MAIKIRDGANGTFKSASCVLYDLLPALRAGRAVITNIEGLLPLDEMQKVLGETFPETARLVRVYSCNDAGVQLWQGWFNWIPPDCMIIIDEAQDIFSKESGFKSTDARYVGVEPYLDRLPDWWPQFFADRLASYKENYVETSSDTDDVGERMFDDDGNPIWPAHFMSACKRHRKYTWDMIWLTPDISDIPTDVRGAAEIAINHANKSIPLLLPRRCRMWERKPKSTGTTPTKGDSTYTKKIDLKAFLVYRSTLSGKFTKSGLGTLPPGLKFALFCLLLCLGGFIYAAFFLAPKDADTVALPSGQVNEEPRRDVDPQKTAPAPVVDWPFTVKVTDLFFDIRSPKISGADDFFSRHMNIKETPVLKGFSRAGTKFSVVFESENYFIGSDELDSYGIIAVPVPNLCAVVLRRGNDITYAQCDISRRRVVTDSTPQAAKAPLDMSKLL